jgi:DNA-binding NtrC family response regulator
MSSLAAGISGSRVHTERYCVLVLQNDLSPHRDLIDPLMDGGYALAGPFTSLSEANDWTKQETPDAAILDIGLSDGISFELARSLKHKEIPVLFYTSWKTVDPVPLELGDVPFLQKPVHASRIPKLLSQAIMKNRLRKRIIVGGMR